MNTKILINHIAERRCQHGKDSLWSVHERVQGRGRPVGIRGWVVCRRSGQPSFSLPKSTLEAWVRAAKAGKLGNVGNNRRPLTEVEVELARRKRELVVVRMERDILKKSRRVLCQGVAAPYALMDEMRFTEIVYNRQRKQKKLGYLSPAAFERRFYKLQRVA